MTADYYADRRRRADIDTLTQARALLADPDHWYQGAYAVAAYEVETDPGDEDAIAWCPIGAILKVADAEWDPALSPLATAIHPTGRYSRYSVAEIADWNDDDERTHADVLAAFDRAIDSLTGETA